MSTLQEKLDNLKANFEKSAPENALAIMHRVTRDLKNSGIMDGVAKVGDTAPDFELKNNDNKIIRLKDVLAENPVVLSFFRGQW
jgi:AhpC/TSA family